MKLTQVHITLLFFLCSFNVLGQERDIHLQGEVSFVTSSNIYVRFLSTERLSEGDTLFMQHNNVDNPVLVITNLSSMSCVSELISKNTIQKGDIVFFKNNDSLDIKENPLDLPNDEEQNSEIIEPVEIIGNPLDQPARSRLIRAKKPKENVEKINSRISVGSYSNFDEDQKLSNQRLQYTMSFNGDNLRNSKFSAQSYISMRYKTEEWGEVKNDVFSALKIYNMSASYQMDSTSRLDFGRKVNYNISSVGVIDGVQYEKRFNHVKIGGLAGFRPDYRNYGFDFNLPEVGVFIAYNSAKSQRFYQNTMAFMEQRNRGAIDRRFLYFQHSNNLNKNWRFFGSCEVNLYTNYEETPKNTFDLNSVLLNVRYRPNRKISFSSSFDSRKNVVYFESIRTYVDSIIEAENRQGLRFRMIYRPWKKITWSIGTNMRFQSGNNNLSRTYNSYLNISRIPGVKANVSISGNYLMNGYLEGSSYTVRLNKSLFKGKLYASTKYRYVDYQYASSTELKQHSLGFDFTWRIVKGVSFSTYYEGTIQGNKGYIQWLNLKLIRRFRK